MLGEDEFGRWVASIIVLIMPRQNGKNAVLEALELYAFYVLDEPRILHTAHLAKTAGDHMRRMVELVRANEELEAITHIRWSNGKEALERIDTGARLEFITRGRKTARGGSPTRIVFDEALFLTDEQVQSILPAMSAQSMNADPPQFVYTSSAPLPESTVLHRVRDRGIGGNAGRMFMAEWSIDVADVNLDDPAVLSDQLHEANPGMGIRIAEDWVLENELATMSEEAFLIERLGVIINAAAVEAVKLPADRWAETWRYCPPRCPEDHKHKGQRAEFLPGEITLAYAIAPDGLQSSIAIGGQSLQNPYVQVIDDRPGAGWLPGRLVELIEKWNPIAVGCVGAGPSAAQVGPILQAFVAAGVDANRLTQVSMTDYRAACAGLYTDVVEGRLERPAGQGPLDLAVSKAEAQVSGDSWKWDIRNATVPICTLESVTVARALLPVTVEPEFWYA